MRMPPMVATPVGIARTGGNESAVGGSGYFGIGNGIGSGTMATYKEAGVDIDAQDKALEQVKKMVRKTYTPEVLSDQGAFGGLFRVPKGFKEPVLVSSCRYKTPA